MDTVDKQRAAFNVGGGARYLGVGETRFRALLRSGAIASRKYGRRVIVSKIALDRWLAGTDGAAETN
jgi:excisionase family DNA binding protein